MKKQHGEKSIRKFRVNQGKTVYVRFVRYCVVHGEIDCFLHPNFELEHGDCQNTPTGKAAAKLPKALQRAA
jgi:hypothetical protein